MAKKNAKKTEKKTEKKVAKPVKKADPSGFTPKQTAFLLFLLKRKATSVANAIDRKLVWKNGGTMTIMHVLKTKDLTRRADHEEGLKCYYLTAAGKKVAIKLSKLQSS